MQTGFFKRYAVQTMLLNWKIHFNVLSTRATDLPKTAILIKKRNVTYVITVEKFVALWLISFTWKLCFETDAQWKVKFRQNEWCLHCNFFLSFICQSAHNRSCDIRALCYSGAVLIIVPCAIPMSYINFLYCMFITVSSLSLDAYYIWKLYKRIPRDTVRK